ncbi:hypothetical protein BT93_L2974 [Corymbia citriodora subsp. variegata]|uniref:Disease resistance R13L4/SHOC-2-like LRR domain-containing protein n=1 Tax=Corymbia citriodora subsp. variegata TaxID=360336 RepID=A0A8T0CIB0_CORYI|nr:hypothetical protein BT93_L2974 [Corymbia citriodora subsp. variegata]
MASRGRSLRCYLHRTLHSNNSLFALRHLQSLNLASNNFRISPFLPELSVFTELRHLNLSCSHFSSLVPVEISSLSKLVLLDLSFNYKIENTGFKMLVQSLTGLRDFDLYYVDMSAVSPNSFMNLSSSDSNWSNSLESLTLLYISISGKIPDSIGELKNVKTLDLRNCKFTGSIPSLLVNLKKLTRLDLSSNESIGHIPSVVVKLERLVYLDLSLNNFTTVLDVRMFSTLKNLQELCLTGPLPSSICKSSSLIELILARNNFSSSIPQCLGNLTNLFDLDLSANKFEGTFPRSLDNCPSLTILNVNYNKINNTFPKWVDLSKNRFEGPLPIPPPTTRIYSTANKKFGVIPRKFDEDSQLRTIDFSQNQFEGTLPRSLLHSENLEIWDLALPKLQVLVLRSNMFHGSVSSPRAARPFSKLRIFDLSNDNLSDLAMVIIKGMEIQLAKIIIVFTSINLLSNHFDGKLLVDIGNLKFTGKIPQELADLTSLEFLNLSENQLIGPIPQGRQFNTFKNDSFVKNPGLCRFPLLETCGNISQEIPPVTILEENDTEQGGWFELRAMLMGYGCGIIAGVSLGYIVLGSKRFEWLAVLLERKGANMKKKWMRNACRSYQR